MKALIKNAHEPGRVATRSYFFPIILFCLNLSFVPHIKSMRRPGIEPGSTAWKAAMLTIIPPTLGV